MKNFVLLLSVVLSSVLFVHAKEVTITKTFDLVDFEISIEDNSEIQILSQSTQYDYLEPGSLAIPQSILAYAIAKNEEIKDIRVSEVKRIPILQGYEMSKVPGLSIIGQSIESKDVTIYPNSKYGNSIEMVELFQVNEWDGVNVANIRVSPFEYEADGRKLWFVESCKITIGVEESKEISVNTFRIGSTSTVSDIVKSLVVNPEDVDEIISNCPRYNSSKGNYVNSAEKIDYLIITDSNLAPSFEPLIKLRQRLGLRGKIATTEDIYRLSDQTTPQLKIKEYIRNLYTNNGLTYVLLGGDDSVVPVQYCRGKALLADSTVLEGDIPCDAFFASTEGKMDWDTNNNGIIGEYEDEVSFSQSVYLTRLPVRTSNDVNAFISKIRKYEKNPLWAGKALLSGVKLTTDPTAKCHNDAELQAKKIYGRYLSKSWWEGDSVCFFDSHTSFDGGSRFDVTADNLQTVLSEGYDIIYMLTHGSNTGWKMETGSQYSSDKARTLNSRGFSIIATAACNTNAFDCFESGTGSECLSEAFIRNEKSGVLAYYGCSREALGSVGTPSPKGCAEQALHPFLTIGGITLYYNGWDWGQASAKTKFASSFQMASNNWNRLSFNGIGDPAMMINLKNPHTFPKNSILINDTDLKITCEPDSRAVVMSLEDNGRSFFLKSSAEINLGAGEFPMKGIIALTAKNYIPYSLSYAFVQNETFETDTTIEADLIYMGGNVTEGSSEGEVICKGGVMNLRGKELVLDKGFSVAPGAQLEFTISD